MDDLISHRLSQERQNVLFRIQAINFDERTLACHNCGRMDIICHFCSSKNWIAERPSDGKFSYCCRKGRIKLPQPLDSNGQVLHYPDFLHNLLLTAHFRDNIRSYNNAVSFASMGAQSVTFNGPGPHVFKVHGQTYHRTSHLETPP